MPGFPLELFPGILHGAPGIPRCILGSLPLFFQGALSVTSGIAQLVRGFVQRFPDPFPGVLRGALRGIPVPVAARKEQCSAGTSQSNSQTFSVADVQYAF
ncbi:MAG TPA: hypothetical protein PLH97_15640, partial [Verrucomicrobiota bacterium]|nr:hypothetical protein [Verrucomicrobiota bacterium]